MKVERGVTRTVILVGRWAVKLPGGLMSKRSMFWIYPLRGWLANRSEWRQRWRPDVCRPILTFFHLALVMPRADYIADESSLYPLRAEHDMDLLGLLDIDEVDSTGDERKPSSWGWFGDRWELIDYDRSWQQEDRGLIGGLYYGRQERLARKWAAP